MSYNNNIPMTHSNIPLITRVTSTLQDLTQLSTITIKYDHYFLFNLHHLSKLLRLFNMPTTHPSHQQFVITDSTAVITIIANSQSPAEFLPQPTTQVISIIVNFQFPTKFPSQFTTQLITPKTNHQSPIRHPSQLSLSAFIPTKKNNNALFFLFFDFWTTSIVPKVDFNGMEFLGVTQLFYLIFFDGGFSTYYLSRTKSSDRMYLIYNTNSSIIILFN